ncbi:MAG TPA: hypothetical protein VMD75_17185 [Candidatus Binataceae bacterium]|nr:hypothetical protein [Candidatus Binataceae bacterium]
MKPDQGRQQDTQVPSLDRMLEIARELGEQAERMAPETERNRRTDDATVYAMVESGLVKVLQSRRFGGYESGFPDFVRIGRTLALYDVSLSWLYNIFGIHHWFGAFVDPKLQDELWGNDPNVIFVDSFAPTGRAELTTDGFRLNGRWSFLSGLPWARWCGVGVIAPYEAGSEPEHLMLFVPEADYRVLDDWYTIGLRGSASASIEVHDVFVPRYRAFRLGPASANCEAPGLALNPGTLYRVPFTTALQVALLAPTVGGAQAVAARFRKTAISRAPLFQQRQAELVMSQTTLADSMVTLEMLEQMLYRYADELMELGVRGGTLDREGRLRMFAWRAYMARQARLVATNLADIAGARALFETEPLQRFWRDVHAIGQHVGVNYEAGMRNYGRALMGLEPDIAVY